MACVAVSLLVVLLFLEMILRPQQQLGLGLELLGTFPEDIRVQSNSTENFDLRGVENDEFKIEQII